ncbi:MAG: flagellar motor switch protein FliN [Deltaproteobacteria bacterium]|nr:flagellar motor switch protein FliN [Deltaproteobacteria bacterium]
MADEKDPFEDALNALDDLETDKEAPPEGLDPFEEAKATADSAAAAPASDDPFEAALQIAKTEHKISEASKTAGDGSAAVDLRFLKDIKVNLSFEVGRAKMFISDLLSLGQGSVIELHRLVGEELELFINGHLLATGEVVVVNEKFGAKIIKIIDPKERVKKLGSYR